MTNRLISNLKEKFIFAPRRFFQRAKKGYCEEDLWDIDDWFIRTMSKMLKEFNENNIGFPAVLLKYYDNNEEAASKAWNNILNELQRLLNKMEGKKFSITEDEQKEYDDAKEKFFLLFTKWFDHLWI